MSPFQVPHNGPHGKTLYAQSPKLCAYNFLVWLEASGYCGYTTVYHDDGAITVKCPGMEDTTYVLDSKK